MTRFEELKTLAELSPDAIVSDVCAWAVGRIEELGGAIKDHRAEVCEVIEREPYEYEQALWEATGGES